MSVTSAAADIGPRIEIRGRWCVFGVEQLDAVPAATRWNPAEAALRRMLDEVPHQLGERSAGHTGAA
jgi:hypothetical protein